MRDHLALESQSALNLLIAGVDEAGRGPLAGPVVAAAVILAPDCQVAGMADSKVLTAMQREKLDVIIRQQAICYSVAEASVEEIDRLNILQATLLAMRRAVEGLRYLPQKVLVDGNRLPVVRMAAEAIVRGDATVACISAASILAKVHRDRLCLDMHRDFPHFNFAQHKGYGTREHLAALQRHGACSHHRRSFAPVAQALLAGPDSREESSMLVSDLAAVSHTLKIVDVPPAKHPT